MSAINDALKGIKQLLTLQMQVESLEESAKIQRADMKAMASDLIALAQRVARIEGIMEGYARASAAAPRPRQRRLPKE